MNERMNGTAGTNGTASVTEYMQLDHARLDAIVDDVRSSVASSSFGKARERFADVVSGLGRHIDVEEQILFPAFEQMTGMTAGPTTVMRREHVEIRRLLDAVASALEGGDASAFAEAIEALTEVLGAHNEKEERVLYPMTDRTIGSGAPRDALVSRLRSSLEAR